MVNSVKTIFITSFHPVISRNILSSGVLDLLSKKHRVVILCPELKKDYFKKEYAGVNILVEGVNMRLTKGDLFFRTLSLVLSPTKALYIKRRSQYFQDKKFFGYFFYTVASKIIGGFKIFANIARYLDVCLFKTIFFKPLFEKYLPEIVFSTDLQNELDIRLLKEAGMRRIKTLGMIRSWDNLTSKGVLRLIPDRVIVQNNIVKEEAKKYSFIATEIISAIGIPHYDKYFSEDFGTREKFFSKFGFDLNKELILFSPIGDRYIRDNYLDQTVLETLSQIDANILVRKPPTDNVNFKNFRSRGANVVFQETGVSAGPGSKKLSEIAKEDDNALAESLYFCDLVVTGQSTLTIDAAVFKKPIIVIYFDFEPRVYWDSVKRYYDYEYFRPILKSGGIRLANNPKELLKTAIEYLDNPGLDKEGRDKIVKEQVLFTDGMSVNRLAEAITSFL